MTPKEKLAKIKDLVQEVPEPGDGLKISDDLAKQMNDALNTIIDIIDSEESEVEECKRKIKAALEEHDCYLMADDPYCWVELRERGSTKCVIIK